MATKQYKKTLYVRRSGLSISLICPMSLWKMHFLLQQRETLLIIDLKMDCCTCIIVHCLQNSIRIFSMHGLHPIHTAGFLSSSSSLMVSSVYMRVSLSIYTVAAYLCTHQIYLCTMTSSWILKMVPSGCGQELLSPCGYFDSNSECHEKMYDTHLKDWYAAHPTRLGGWKCILSTDIYQKVYV